MELKSKRVIGTAAAAAVVLGSFGTAYALPAQETYSPDNAAAAERQSPDAATRGPVKSAEVGGVFTATQSKTATAKALAKAFRGASAVLCNTELHEEGASGAVPEDAMEWTFRVTGDVKNAYSATVGDLVNNEDGVQTTVIGCACMGNPSDGRSVANAEVTGLNLQALIMAASPTGSANAITFISADGYRQTLPLYYVFTHSSVLAYEVAGEPVSESMGGTVQVWIHGLAASYYVADVVSIEISTLDEAPLDPSQSDSFVNSPNVTVLAAK